MRLRNGLIFVSLLGCLGSVVTAQAEPPSADTLSPKQLNDPLPPHAMPPPTPPGAVPPRGTPEGMGNETHFSKTPGDDDPSDGVDEPGRNPVPGQPRDAPGVERP